MDKQGRQRVRLAPLFFSYIQHYETLVMGSRRPDHRRADLCGKRLLEAATTAAAVRATNRAKYSR